MFSEERCNKIRVGPEQPLSESGPEDVFKEGQTPVRRPVRQGIGTQTPGLSQGMAYFHGCFSFASPTLFCFAYSYGLVLQGPQLKARMFSQPTSLGNLTRITGLITLPTFPVSPFCLASHTVSLYSSERSKFIEGICHAQLLTRGLTFFSEN